MRTAVIVPSIGRRDKLRHCLDSLRALDDRPNDVLVVFQGSEDPALTAAVRVLPPAATVVWTGRRGAAAARNAGAAHTAADLLLFVDDDCVVDRVWLGCYRTAFDEDPRLMVAGGQVRPYGTTNLHAQALGLQLDLRPRVVDRLTNPVGTADRSGNLAVRREAFFALGGFDEGLGAGTSFPSAEDTDFVYRAMRAGFRLRYIPEAIVDHDQWRAPSEAIAVEQGYAIGLGAFLITHVRRGDAYALGLVFRNAWHLGVLPIVDGAIHLRRHRLRSGWHYLSGIPRGMLRGLRRPAEHGAGREVSRADRKGNTNGTPNA
jgi:glycosyltransferase involved in cell wall biosynthesis